MFLEANLKKLVISSVHTSLHPYILKRSLPGNFPGGSEVKASASNMGDRGLFPGFDPWVGKFPWRRKWQPTPVFLPGEFHGRRSLVGYSPRGCKESDTTE